METLLENIELPICLDTKNGELVVVTAQIPKGNLREPFLIDSLSARFGIAHISDSVDSEQNVLVRPLHYSNNDERIQYFLLKDFIAKYADKVVSENNIHFIFHMSRCGSTLATQMISAIDRFYVISEPTIVNEILDPSIKLSKDISRWKLLKAAINAIFLSKPEHCEHVFIKFRSWNIFFLDEILSLYPNITWAFIHRNGIEVMESVLRDPPGWLRGRKAHTAFFSRILNVTESELQLMDNEEYSARILGAMCNQAISHKSEKSLYIPYEEIPTSLPEFIDKAFSLDINLKEKEAMTHQSIFYSKNTSEPKIFMDDSARKRKELSQSGIDRADIFIETFRKKLS